MLKLLLKKQLFEIFRSYFYDAKKNKARSRLATALYIGLFVLLMAGILGGIFTLLAVKLCGRTCERILGLQLEDAECASFAIEHGSVDVGSQVGD